MKIAACVALGLLSYGATAAEDRFALYPSVSVTSDYRYNGVSYSDGRSAWQGSLYASGPRQLFAGLWVATVDFNDPGDTSVEVTAYGGRNFDLVAAKITLDVLYTFYPDKTFRGPTYDFIQFRGRAQKTFDRVTYGAVGAWSPSASYGAGTSWRSQLDAAYAVAGWLNASAHAGRRWIQRGIDRSYWDAGVTLSRRRLSLDVRYVDTDLDLAGCRFATTCSSAIVGTLTYRFY